ncbi:hypothetical protein FHG87_019591 [Trinorchestia longiramus]|nr:hypothetical protein FHG87_019591 [Trinorchestia longiramus]
MTRSSSRLSIVVSHNFVDKKTWTVDPVRIGRNDRYLSFGEVDDSARTLSTTKYPASLMSLDFIASNGDVIPLIWFPTGYRLTARDYEDKLANMLVPWVSNTFDMSSVTVVLQQDSTPAHTSNRVQGFLQEQNFSFWPKYIWPLNSPDVNSLDYAFWLHIEAKASHVRYPKIITSKASVNDYEHGLRCQDLQNLQAPSRGHHRCIWRLY